MLHLNANQIRACRGYIPGLDGLRAISISIVLFGHFFLEKYLGLSALGVYIFFAISGFLITRLLFAELNETANISIGKFYYRRFLRLYPVLIAYMLCMIGIAFMLQQPVVGVDIGSVFFYFTNYYQSWHEYHNTHWTLPIGPLWSLAVEEHFYIIAPLFIVLVKGRIRPVLIFSILMCLIPLLIRFAYVAAFPEVLGTNIIYRLSETRFDSIAWGMLLATLCELDQRERIIDFLSSHKAICIGIILIFGSYVIRDAWFVDTLRYTLRSVGMVPLIAGTVFSKNLAGTQAFLEAPLLRWVGRLSYSLYIWHSGASYYKKLFPWEFTSSIAMGFALLSISLVLACVSYYFIEQPFLHLRHRFPFQKENTPELSKPAKIF
jgi:peptidoglycan/LPS O-acetylase OafA/YrhL